MSGRYGVAIVGTGNMGQVHANVFSTISETWLCGVYGSDTARREAFAKRYGITAYDSYEKLIADDNVGIVAIANVHSLHADMGMQAAAAGKHLLIEKPIDIAPDKARALVETCQRHGVKLGIVCQKRYLFCRTVLKNIIETNRLGRILFAQATFFRQRSQKYYDAAGGWRGKAQLAGGGVFIMQAIHDIDLLLWLLGPVQSVCGSMVRTRFDIEVEDTGVGIMAFKNGALGVIKSATSVPATFPNRVEVYGEKGYFITADDMIVDWKFPGAGVQEKLQYMLVPRIHKLRGRFMKTSLHELQIRDYLRFLDGEHRTVVADGEEGLYALTVLRALYTSSEQGRTIEL